MLKRLVREVVVTNGSFVHTRRLFTALLMMRRFTATCSDSRLAITYSISHQHTRNELCRDMSLLRSFHAGRYQVWQERTDAPPSPCVVAAPLQQQETGTLRYMTRFNAFTRARSFQVYIGLPCLAFQAMTSVSPISH